jgi:hypothetical protein
LEIPTGRNLPAYAQQAALAGVHPDDDPESRPNPPSASRRQRIASERPQRSTRPRRIQDGAKPWLAAFTDEELAKMGETRD